MDDALIEQERQEHGASWRSGEYHKLDSRTGACLTCNDRRPGETGLDHLMRTARWHGYDIEPIVI